MNTKIKQLFAQLIKLSQYQNDNRTLIYEGELQIGTEVFVEGEEGEIIPAPDGVYGEYTVVAGVIVDPTTVNMEDEPQASHQAVDEEKEVLIKENEELRAKITELEAKIAELESANEEMSQQKLSAEEQLKQFETQKSTPKNNFGRFFEK